MINSWREKNGFNHEEFGKLCGFKGKNPATLSVRICLQGKKKYWKLPSAEIMILIQDKITQGEVKIEDMVRDYVRKSK